MLFSCRNFFFLILLFISILPFKTYSKNILINDAIDPYCSGKSVNKFLEENKIKNIEIIIDKNKRWIKNILSALVEFNSNESKTEHTGVFNFAIRDKYKKKFNSTLIVNFEEKNLSCKFRATIRMTGDIWLHLDWKKGQPISSIYVEILDGHINSITKFKLLLPKSRDGLNEIFVASLFRELNFLSPRSFMTSATINGFKYKYIFQEDIRKEFLEKFLMKEGPILEGDERFTVVAKDEFRIPKLSLARLSNRNYSLKGTANSRIALTATSKLNQIYLQHHQIEISKSQYYYPYDKLLINSDKFFTNKNNKELFQTYEALIYALDADHSLSQDDRRFYFDPIYKYYLPIYYDGKSRILDEEQWRSIEILSKGASLDAKKGSNQAAKLIETINHPNFRKILIKNGIKISKDHYERVIERILERLKIIKNSDPSKIKFHEMDKYFSNLKPNIGQNKKLIFVNYEKKKFYICSFDLQLCNKKNLDENQNSLAKILGQRYKDSNNNNSLGMDYLFINDKLNYETGNNISKVIWNKIKINNQFYVKYNNYAKINVNNDKKEIEINQISSLGRTIISGKTIDDWKIFFKGKNNLGFISNTEENPSGLIKDYLGITGCVTLIDVEVNNISIFSEKSSCEDSINFIRVKGSVKIIEILDSESDGLDLDFSDLKIDWININSAKNDCIDLSHGNYLIDKVDLDFCGDKAISIGEKSLANLNKVKINNSKIGISAKDSSSVLVEESLISNSEICFSAYRKKQEFSGAKMRILKTNCEKNQLYEQQGSKIILG
jgi:hypothetical protein